MKVCFRVDASIDIGTGHFIRCLTLAKVLKQQGVHACFVCRDLPVHLQNMLIEKDIEFLPLGKTKNINDEKLSHSKWLGTSQEEDAQATISAISKNTWDWLVVDHYALDFNWETALRQSVRKILVIDDIADRRHDCDVLLDQNYYANMNARYTNLVPARCELLLGPRYALLREEFRKFHERVKPRTGSVKKILVFFGGVDSNNFTGTALDVLSGLDISGISVDVVIGAQHPCIEELETICENFGYTCHIQTDKMAELIASADLAVGCGGTAIWERCCLGLPTLVFSTADNQTAQVSDATKEGLVYGMDRNHDLRTALKIHISAILGNTALRELLSRNALKMVDGKGALRLSSIMNTAKIEIRRAKMDDSETIFHWRNHKNIKAVSRNNSEISPEQHRQWFESALSDDNRILLIGQQSGHPIGVVRFDKQDDEAEVSIYLDPEQDLIGLGRSLLKSAELWLIKQRTGINKIRAEALGTNEHSQKFFLGAGYDMESVNYSKRIN